MGLKKGRRGYRREILPGRQDLQQNFAPPLFWNFFVHSGYFGDARNVCGSIDDRYSSKTAVTGIVLPNFVQKPTRGSCLKALLIFGRLLVQKPVVAAHPVGV